MSKRGDLKVLTTCVLNPWVMCAVFRFPGKWKTAEALAGKIGAKGKNRRRAPRDAFTGVKHRQAGTRFSSSYEEPGITVLLSWDLKSMSREPTWRACVSLLRLSKSQELAVRPVRVHNRVDFVTRPIRPNVYTIVQ